MKYQYRDLFNLHPTAKTFLDLGCGQGFVSLYAAARGLEVDAIDKEEETPSSLQEISKVSYLAADLNTWKPAKKYDIIVAIHSIQFLQKEHALREFLPSLCESLNEGGLLEVFSFTPEEKVLSVPTTYTLEEIALSINSLKILRQKTFSYEGMHRELGKHTFHELHVIGKKI